MTPKVEKKRAFIINFAFLALVLGIIYVFFKYLFWVTAPFVLSFFFAVLLQKPLRFLTKKTTSKWRGFWSIVLVLVSISIILLPLAILISALISQVVNFVNYLAVELSDFPQFIATAQDNDPALPFLLTEWGSKVVYFATSMNKVTVDLETAFRKHLTLDCVSHGVKHLKTAINLMANRAVDPTPFRVNPVKAKDIQSLFATYNMMPDRDAFEINVVNLLQ